jgi:steroid delta-isomerase-like uncharacterized protein
MESDSTRAQANIELIRSAFAALNSANLDTCARFLTDDFVINLAGMPYQMRGRDAWIQNAQVMQSAFPGIQARIDDVFSVDDRIAVRLTFKGTHKGEFLGIPATGHDVEYTSIELYRVADGKLAEEWISSDTETLMRQLTEPRHPEILGPNSPAT